MTSFSALLVHDTDDPPSWHPADPGTLGPGALDLDGADDIDADALADLVADTADHAGVGADAVLVVLEREDEWFLLAREVDGELAVFVSDAEAAATSRCADLVADAEPAPAAPAGPADQDRASVPGPGWAGRPGLLADLGVGPGDLVSVSEGHDTSQALAVLGERAGFGDALEALR